MKCQYISNYKTNTDLIKSYFAFTQIVFDFDLVELVNAEGWDTNYMLHSLVYNEQIIANISISIMCLQIQGKDTPAIQLGSVGVLPEYRKKGLSRILMNTVLEEYKKFPLAILFANDAVLDFYPKFGFRRINEVVPIICLPDNNDRLHEAEKITLESPCLRRLLKANLQKSSIIDARGNNSVYMFHLLYYYRNDIYYIKDIDVAFIARYHGDSVILVDVLSALPIEFDQIAGYVLKNNTKTVRFAFTPDWLLDDYDIIPDNHSKMFVLGALPQKLPAFKIPVTAHT